MCRDRPTGLSARSSLARDLPRCKLRSIQLLTADVSPADLGAMPSLATCRHFTNNSVGGKGSVTLQFVSGHIVQCRNNAVETPTQTAASRSRDSIPAATEVPTSPLHSK